MYVFMYFIMQNSRSLKEAFDYSLTDPCVTNWFTCYEEERRSGVSIPYGLSSPATCSPTVDLFQITNSIFKENY